MLTVDFNLLYCYLFGWNANMVLGMSSNQQESILYKAVESSVSNTSRLFLVYHTVTTDLNWIYLDSTPLGEFDKFFLIWNLRCTHE